MTRLPPIEEETSQTVGQILTGKPPPSQPEFALSSCLGWHETNRQTNQHLIFLLRAF